MSKKGLDEIVLIIDRSASMAAIEDEARDGLNKFLESQKDFDGREARVTVAIFNDTYEIVHNGVELDSVPYFTKENYVPEGLTALFDAVGRTIDSVGKRLAETPEDERPENVIVAIMTDGEENASKEFSLETVRSRIEIQSDNYGWIFDFLGANIDAATVGQALGIDKTLQFDTTAAGMKTLSSDLTARVVSYRQ